MPVVTLYLQRLQKLVGISNRSKIIEALPYLGLDIEEESEDYVRVEYSPNRPDYATDVGIAAGLQGILGIKKGLQKLIIKKSDKSSYIQIYPLVKKVRPYICGIIAKSGKLDDEAIKQLITLQEDLHLGVARRRKKASIGIHDLDKLTLPLSYTAVSEEHSFIPLNMNQNLSIREILNQTDTGKQYGRLVGDKFPVILDANDNTISLPPIINSSLTTVTTKTNNILVEVTGTDRTATEDVLAVVTMTLQNMGFSLYELKTSSNKINLSKTRLVKIDATLVNKILGLNLKPAEICSCLKKARLEATFHGKKIFCRIPRFRFDIFGSMDIIEEVALGYGIQKITPTLPLSSSVGGLHQITKKTDYLSQIMIGLGYTEVVNQSLSSRRILYDATMRQQVDDAIEVVESKSQEYTILRDSLLPAMMENLSKNIHESYPQKIFEIGTIFSADSPINEVVSFGCLNAHKETNFAEMKSVLQSVMKTTFNMDVTTKTAEKVMFAKGRTASVELDGKSIGVVGQIDNGVVENFKLRVPVCGFEINLSGLLD